MKFLPLAGGLVFTMEAQCYRGAVACNGGGSPEARETFTLPRGDFGRE